MSLEKWKLQNWKKLKKIFELWFKSSERGAIGYGTLLISEVIDDIDKIISLDIRDILFEKNLYNLYNKNLGFNKGNNIMEIDYDFWKCSSFKESFCLEGGNLIILQNHEIFQI
jgi:hypothetical protein